MWASNSHSCAEKLFNEISVTKSCDPGPPQYTLGAETFARRKIREIFAFREHKLSRIGKNRIFRVLNFREWTEKLIFLLF